MYRPPSSSQSLQRYTRNHRHWAPSLSQLPPQLQQARFVPRPSRGQMPARESEPRRPRAWSVGLFSRRPLANLTLAVSSAGNRRTFAAPVRFARFTIRHGAVRHVQLRLPPGRAAEAHEPCWPRRRWVEFRRTVALADGVGCAVGAAHPHAGALTRSAPAIMAASRGGCGGGGVGCVGGTGGGVGGSRSHSMVRYRLHHHRTDHTVSMLSAYCHAS